jgi:acetoacetyl-CoA synthetase
MGHKAAFQALWTPSETRIQGSRMQAFLKYVEGETGLRFADYAELQAWSCDDLLRFWELAAHSLGVRWDRKPEATYQPATGGGILGGEWFPKGRLSWLRNMLPNPDDPSLKIISIIEGRQQPILYTGAQLYQAVVRCARALQKVGVTAGDRVAAVVPNTVEAVIGSLATASLGAVWSSASPDFGAAGIVDRFGQIEPKVLLATHSYVYGGKCFDCRETAKEVQRALPSLRACVLVDPLDRGGTPDSWQSWDEFLSSGEPLQGEVFEPMSTSFSHPLYILFSSGTTGKPKCIVHSVGGTLLQHKKELMLHCDLGPGKRLLYFTTCGWMMWNWMVSALGTGASLLLFEGSIAPEDFGVLWRMVAEHKVQCFGTSPKFLAACQKAGLKPQERFDLSALETLLSTGAPLMPEQFDWVYQNVKSDLHLASISGGTDIISCFMLGNPISPVYGGEIQGAGLGMALACWDAEGRPLQSEKGELVCTKPFPSMPLGFWGDHEQRRYREAYFQYFPQKEVWRHGDFIELRPHGGIVVYGRSDATLNPGGVRIGTAEIYRQVETFPEVQDSLAVSLEQDGDAVMLLFVKLREGLALDAQLTQAIKKRLKEQLSPRHVPAGFYQVPDIPYTRSGKKLELAVTRLLQDLPLDNESAIANPECLAAYRHWAEELKRPRGS